MTEQEEGGRIIGRHERGEQMLRVAVEYDGQHYLVRLLATSGFKTQPAADGSVAVQFGGCDVKIPNCIPIMKGWNYTVRLYRPQKQILDGTWKFPEAKPI